ncbi:MAG: lipase family protein [Burkholderiales bacterium]|nr:lipase family protein [Burkholderiales bacterium]
MVAELTPQMAAAIAKNVYSVKNEEDWTRLKNRGSAELDKSMGLTGGFTLNPDSSRFSGTSGGNILRATSGFGHIAAGVGSRSNEALIAIRGTASPYDGLTDLMQSVARSPSGYTVHAGFKRTFDSFKPTIAEFLSRSSGISTIHVVGHSLGGALATITADFLAEQRMATKLYTFGCPRTGFEGFSRQLTQKVGVNNIFRVYHSSDPVPMVPIFPFLHAPVNSEGFMLPWDGMNVSINAHFMDNYIQSIGAASWDGLLRSAPEKGKWEQAEAWLQQAANSGGKVKMYSAKAMWMIMKCMDWILGLIGKTIGLVALVGVTIMDRLVQVLYQGALASVSIAGHVANLIAAIMRFLGRTAVTGARLTVDFIAWVLNMLFNFVSSVAQSAVQRLM